MKDQLRSRAGVRSYANRGGRLRQRRRLAMERLLDLHGLEPDKLPIWNECMPYRELHAEIGPGNGEAAIDFAQRHHDCGLVVFEVYPAAVASILSGIEQAKLNNIKVVWADAVPLLPKWFPSNSLASLRIFFPDPWPKRRHHKRRLVSRDFLSMVAPLLRPDGILHLATDWQDYSEAMLKLLEGDQGWEVIGAGQGAQVRSGRCVTRFEQRAIAEGRSAWDCLARPVR